ncbi:hypothetical protein GQ600_9370 [Phytophthora cactorum]|nr:hypothetical protein GQ600_9370 [Phytophthora cactorum]
MESIPLPELLTCRLRIKNGELFDACRDKVPPSPEFWYKVSEVYSILRKKIEEHFESKLPGQWKPPFDIYLKPSNNAKQKQIKHPEPDSAPQHPTGPDDNRQSRVDTPEY